MAEIFKNILSNPWAILLVVLFFGASIFVHELGHFLAARWRGLIVERFSIGFGPRLFGWRRNGVDYRISAIPLGGYVALPQLADMRGIEGDSSIPQDEMPSISYADKMIVAVAGAVFNIIFAFIIATIVWKLGVPEEQGAQTTRIGYVYETVRISKDQEAPGPAYTAGIKPGDQILAVDGSPVNVWMDVQQSIMTGVLRTEDGLPLSKLTVQRGEEVFDVAVNPALATDERMRVLGLEPEEPVLVGAVFPNSPADRAGILPGDRIVSIDNEPLLGTQGALEKIREAGTQTLSLTLLRDGKEVVASVTPEIPQSGGARPMIGIGFGREFVTVHIGPLEQIKNGFTMTFKVLGALLNPNSDVRIRNLSGPVGISYALYITAEQGFSMLLFIVAIINVNLAIVNLLPVPVLDGGHMAFATIQKLIGRPLPARFIAGAQGAFMILLFTMVIYITFFDIRRVGTNESARIDAERAASESTGPVFSEKE